LLLRGPYTVATVATSAGVVAVVAASADVEVAGELLLPGTVISVCHGVGAKSTYFKPEARPDSLRTWEVVTVTARDGDAGYGLA